MAIPTVFFDPQRPRIRFRPFKAMHHFRKLVADKEDTVQVFHISECLPSRRFDREARAFCASEHGRKLMASEPYLPDILDDHDALLRLPANSVAHAYVSFMRREGLSAAGLVAESEKLGRPRYPDQMQWYGERLRDTHDLVHVMTGYGRDALGEQCALGFTWGQQHDWTSWFLSWAAALELKRRVKIAAPVLSAVRQSQRNGAIAKRLMEQEIRQLLAEPLEAARKRMGIGDPTHYRAAHQTYRTAGVDPYDFMAPVAA